MRPLLTWPFVTALATWAAIVFAPLTGEAQCPAMMVQDINPGGASSYPSSLTNVNGTVFFTADDGTHGYELWKSDGTPEGTVMVKDINPGSAGSMSYSILTNVDGTLFFTADDGTHGVNGYELWKSDGTPDGTVWVNNIIPDSHFSELTNVNGTLFFSTQANHSLDSGLWKSDGTRSGTVLLRNFSFGSSVRFLTNVNGTLFFAAGDDTDGYEFWKSNGTPDGTVLVKDINPGSADASPYSLTNVNGTLLFAAFDGTHDGLWKSDGTPDGTVMVKEISLGGASSETANVNGTLFFTGDDGTQSGLWKSDGTPDGTVLVSNISLAPYSPASVNGTLFFWSGYGANGTFCKSDGTPGGTLVLKALSPPSSAWAQPSNVDVNGTLFFVAVDWNSRGISEGAALWKSDGTPDGTVLVQQISRRSTQTYLGSLANVNGTLFFAASDGNFGGQHGIELWSLGPMISPVCVGGTTMCRPHITLSGLGLGTGGQSLSFSGQLSFPPGVPPTFDPSTEGAQVLIEDLGSGDAAVFDLTYRTKPIPAGTLGSGCGPDDGWTVWPSMYRNVSNAIDPPVCTAGSANGLTTARFVDKRASKGGIVFTLKTAHSTFASPQGPFRATIVLGAAKANSDAGECSVYAGALDCNLSQSGTKLTCK